jgi:hypothetical protein
MLFQLMFCVIRSFMLSIRRLSDVWETPANVNDKNRMMSFIEGHAKLRLMAAKTKWIFCCRTMIFRPYGTYIS